MRPKPLIRWLPLLLLAVLLILNLIPWQRDSSAFGHPGPFSRPLGWPFPAIACASDEGVMLIDASVVQGDTRIIVPDLFEKPFPHLAWNTTFLFLNLLFAALLVCPVWGVLSLLFLRQRVIRDRRAKNNQCLDCGYELRGILDDSCPECGHVITTTGTDADVQ